jgi:hypothetical protein
MARTYKAMYKGVERRKENRPTPAQWGVGLGGYDLYEEIRVNQVISDIASMRLAALRRVCAEAVMRSLALRDQEDDG